MEYLVRFSQSHETFRRAELEALAELEGVALEMVAYDKDSPFCIVRVADDDAATRLVRRSLLAQSVHSLWGTGDSAAALLADIPERAADLWPPFAAASFKLVSDSFQGKRSNAARRALIDAFGAVLPLTGAIDMATPDLVLTVFEHWPVDAPRRGITEPDRLWLGRFVAGSARDASLAFDLKKRRYIATTSMDAELSLLTANLALAAPGKLFYDPFVGTGSFPVAAAHWGAVAWGSDIDGRAVRGPGAPINGVRTTDTPKNGRTGRCDVRGNFEQYSLLPRFGDVFTADLTHTPLRRGRAGDGTAGRRWIDGIVCDPPYGVREGPRVLGVRNPEKRPWIVESARTMYKDPTYLPPKQPYSFTALLDDLLRFAADTLVDNGRLSFWMPTANDEAMELAVPDHPCLQRLSVCVQVFNKWSRRLITYKRIPDADVDMGALAEWNAGPEPVLGKGHTADELNPFRKGYFTKFEAVESPQSTHDDTHETTRHDPGSQSGT